MAKIALISDVHLGTRQYGLKERYEDFLESFRRFGKDVARKVDAVVIGGDLFDSPRPDARSVLAAQGVVESIKAEGTPVFGIDGNHDLSRGDWMEVVGAFPLPDCTPWKYQGIRMVGINYRSGRDFVDAIQQMVDRGVEADILVAHFALAEMNGGGTADTGVQEICPMLEKLGVKCVLMGHVHIPDARKWNGILFVNPGSTEMKAVNEPPEKFYFIVDTDTWEAEAVPLTTRAVETVEIVSENDLVKFKEELVDEEMKVDGGQMYSAGRKFYHVIANDSIEDVYKRISAIVHDTGAIARIVTRSSQARDVVPQVDAREENSNVLESAVEAYFPKESDEAKLVLSMLRSPDPSSVRLICEKFMKGD